MNFVTNFLMTTGTRALVTLMLFTNNIIVARAIGTKGMGIYATVTATSAILVLFFSGGMQWANTYLSAKDKNNSKDLFSSSLLFSLAIGILLSTVYPFAKKIMELFGYQNINPAYTLPILISIPLALIWYYNQAIILGMQKINKYNAINIINAFSLLTLSYILLVLLQTKTPGAISSWLLSLVITMVFSIYFLSRYINFSFSLNFSLFISSIKIGLKATTSNVAGFLLLRSDLYLIGYFLGLKAVGLYSIAVLIAESILKIPSIAGTLLAPRIASDKIGNGELLTVKVLRNSVLIGAIICILLAILGKSFIKITFGSNFIPSYSALLWLLPGLLCLSYSVIINNYLGGKGYPSITYIAPGIGLVTNVALNLVLIPKMGINGAALSSTISYAIWAGLVSIYFIKKTKIKFIKTILMDTSDLAIYKEFINKKKLSKGSR